MRCRLIVIGSTTASLMLAASASGQTVIDFFDPPAPYPGLEAFVEDQAGYADNAAATPNVTVDFDGLQLWDTGYADLVNIAYVDSGAGNSREPFGIATVTFTADPGFLVRLDSVDLAGYGGGTFDFDSITVTGGNVPFSQNNVPAPGGPRNTLNFGGITGEQLVLTFNDSDSQEQAAIDNLTFGQIIPEPGALTALALVMPALLSRRRGRRG